MNLRVISLLAVVSLLGGCLTGTPETLLSEKPQGKVQNTGQFPAIGRVPVGETLQMTQAEKEKLKLDLARQVQPGLQQAQGSSSDDYETEVQRLRLLAKRREEELRQRIEGGAPTQ